MLEMKRKIEEGQMLPPLRGFGLGVQLQSPQSLPAS